MKLTTWILFAAALPALAQQPSFDFKSLDKLGANAKESTSINLEGDALKAATAFFGDKLRNLTGIYVHNYEFALKGQYSAQDIDPLRAYVRSLNWTKIIDSKEEEESSEIYIKPLPDGKISGLAVLVAEPKELTVVFIQGTIDLTDLKDLRKLGVPNIKLDHGGKPETPKKD